MGLDFRQTVGGFLRESGDDVGLLAGLIGELSGVLDHVIEGGGGPDRLALAFGRVEQEQLPGPLPDGFQLLGCGEVQVRIADGGGVGVGQQGAQVATIQNAALRQLRPEDRGQRRQDIDVAGDAVARRAGGDASRPAHEARFADAAFEVGRLVARERRCRTAGGAVVGGEDHERVFIQELLAQGGHDLADRPIDLFDRIADGALRALALEAFGGRQRVVDHRVGQVEEERLGAFGAQELDRLLRVATRQLRLVWLGLDDLFPAVERERWVARAALLHVIAVGETEVVVEALTRRHEFREVSEVPLADHHGFVAT